MKLPKLAIENHQFTLVMVLLLTLMGVASFFSMPRSEDPQYDAPWVSVVAVYPGAGTVDLEQLVVDPLEEALGELEDLKKVSTSIQDGVAVLWVNFAPGSDPEEKYNELAEHVAALRGDLPASMDSS